MIPSFEDWLKSKTEPIGKVWIEPVHGDPTKWAVMTESGPASIQDTLDDAEEFMKILERN